MSGFVMVPAWLRRRKPSGNAVIAYITLASFGTFNPETGTYDECRPALATMSEECGLQERTLQRGITELIGYGAVERTVVVCPIRGRQPSIYRVIFGRLEGPQQTTTEEIVSPVVGEVSPVTDPLTSETVTGVTREVSPVTPGRRQESHGGGVTSDVEPRTPTTDNPDTKKNTNALARVTGERDPLTSPAFLIDTTASPAVWSGSTPTAGDAGRAHYAETKRVTEDIVSGYKKWIKGFADVSVTASEERDLFKIISGVVNEREPGDDIEEVRNVVVLGLAEWAQSDSFSMKQIPGFIRVARNRKLPKRVPGQRPSKAQERLQRTAQTMAAVAGKTANELNDEWESEMRAVLEKSKAAGFGGALTMGAIQSAAT